MQGFIRNETKKAVFKLQRPLPINSSLTFDDAYLSLGEKSGKKEGDVFVKWLKENHFQDEGWVFYKEEGVPYFKSSAKKNNPAPSEPEVVELPRPKKSPSKGAGRKLTKKARVAESAVTAGAIIEADLPQAKEMIDKTKSRGTLKRALSLANHFSHKEEHRRLIQRRLEEVY